MGVDFLGYKFKGGVQEKTSFKKETVRSSGELYKLLAKSYQTPLILHVRNFQLREPEVEFLALALSTNRVPIETLDLSHATAKEESQLPLLIQALRSNTSLKSLNFGHNVKLVGIGQILDILTNNNYTLTSFSTKDLLEAETYDDKLAVAFLLQRNTFISTNQETFWSAKAWTMAPRNQRLSELIHGVFQVLNLTDLSEIKRVLSIKGPQKRTMIDFLLELEKISNVQCFASLLHTASAADLLPDRELQSCKDGSSLFDLVLSQATSDNNEKLAALETLATFLSINQIDSKDRNIIDQLSRALKRNAVDLGVLNEFLLARIDQIHGVSIKSSWESLLLAICSSKHKPSAENLNISLSTWVKFAKQANIVPGRTTLRRIVTNIIEGHKSGGVSTEAFCGILESLEKYGISFSNTEHAKSVLMEFYDTDIRGKKFFDNFNKFIDMGYDIDISNQGGSSVCEWILIGPGHCKFSAFGKTSRDTKTLKAARFNVFRELKGSDRKGKSKVEDVVLDNEERRQGFKNVLKHFEKHFAENDMHRVKQQLKKTQFVIKTDFDCMSYSITMLRLFELGLCSRDMLFEGRKCAVDVLFIQCSPEELNLFESVDLLTSIGDFSLVKNNRILQNMMMCRNMNGSVVKKFIPWLKKFDFDFNSPESKHQGLTILELIMRLPTDVTALGSIVSELLDAGFDIESLQNKTFCDVLMETEIPANVVATGKINPILLGQPFSCIKIAALFPVILSHVTANKDILKNPFIVPRLLSDESIFLGILKRYKEVKEGGEAGQRDELINCLTVVAENRSYFQWKDEDADSFLHVLMNKNFDNDTLLSIYCVMQDAGFDLPYMVRADKKQRHFASKLLDSLTSNTVSYLRTMRHYRCLKGLDLVQEILESECNLKDACIFADIVLCIVELDKEMYRKGRGKKPWIKRWYKYEALVLEKLFGFNNGSNPTFFPAIKRLCGEDTKEAKGLLNLDRKDQNGRVFRSRLENDNGREVRGWAKRQNAFDGLFRLEPGAPVHVSRRCTVRFASRVSDGEQVALKICAEESMLLELQMRDILRSNDSEEFTKRVLDVKEGSKNSEQFYLVMRRASKSLFDAVNTERFAGRDSTKIVAIARSAAKALKFVNSCGIAHLDFKPRNFMRTDFTRGKWSLIDFDGAMRHGVQLDVPKISTGYCAPEAAAAIFLGSPLVVSEALDVFSFGVVLFELLSGSPLLLKDQTDGCVFLPLTKAQLVNWISLPKSQHKLVLPNAPQSVREKALDLVQWCLTAAADRPTFAEILRHPFLSASGIARPVSLPIEQHIFLSYMQSEGSELAKNVFHNLSGLGLSCWLDVNAQRLTQPDMLRGVLTSRSIVTILTRNTLFRPYCLKELFWAIKMNKQVTFLYESDARFNQFEITQFWNRWNSWDVQKLLEELGSDPFSFEISKLGEQDTMRNTITRFLKEKLKVGEIVPYRRRLYEERVMIDEVIKKSGFVTPEMLSDRTKTKLKLQKGSKIVFIGSDHPKSLELLEFLRRNMDCTIATNFESAPDAFAIITFLHPGFFKDFANQLKGLNLSVELLPVQDGWFQQDEAVRDRELGYVSKAISNKFLVDSEILPWRSAKHESDALKFELLERIRRAHDEEYKDTDTRLDTALQDAMNKSSLPATYDTEAAYASAIEF